MNADDEIRLLRTDLVHAEHTATGLADVIRALRRNLPAECRARLEYELDIRGLEVGE